MTASEIAPEAAVAGAAVAVPVPRDGADVPPMWFIAPDGFHALPIAATAEERAQGAKEFVRELYSEGDEELWNPAAQYYAAVAEMLNDVGLAYSAMGVFATDEGIAHCSFTATAVASDEADPEVVVQGIRAVLGADRFNDVRRIQLPCGPAAACVSLRETNFGAEMSASGEPFALHTGQVQVHVPFPNGPYVAVFTLDTSAVDHWQEFCEMMVTILRTVTFMPAEGEEDAPQELRGQVPDGGE